MGVGVFILTIYTEWSGARESKVCCLRIKLWNLELGPGPLGPDPAGQTVRPPRLASS